MGPESFKNHAVFVKLDQFHQSILLSEETRNNIGIDNMAFFEATYLYIKDRLRHTIPILIQENEMVALASEIEGATSQINAFVGSNNTGNITNAVNNLHSALSRIKNFPFPISKGDFDFSKNISSFQETVSHKYQQLEKLNEQINNDLTTAQENLATKQAEIATIERKLAQKEIEIQNVLLQYNSQFETLKTTANAEIESDRKKFSESIEADRKSYKEQIDEEKRAYGNQFEYHLNSSITQSNDLVEKMNGKLEEAKKIVNIIGNVGVTGNYQTIANDHKKSANFWRVIAMLFMVLMSALLVWSIIELGKNDFSLYKSLVRILAAAVLTYPAIYASRESSKHRNWETKNRNLELELASIGPFIELLPEDKKQKIKEDLVSKYFGNNDQIVTGGNGVTDDVSINGLEQILKAVIPLVKK